MAQQNGSTRQPLLDIDTLAPRDFVRINGGTYFLATPGQNGIRWRLTVNALVERLTELEALGAAMTEDDEREHRTRLDQVVGMLVPDMPADVRDALDDEEKANLVAAFFVARATVRRERIAQTMTISESTSPDSPASTAEATGS